MTERTPASASAAGPDVLASGDDRPPERPGRSLRALVGGAVLVLALVVGVAASVQQERVEDARAARAAADAEVLRLSLGDGRGMPRYGPRPRGGLHLQVRNDGPTPVRLVAAGLSPGQWRLELDAPALLAPGATTVLPLSRNGDCSVIAELRSSSAVLRLEAVVASGRRAVQTLDLTAAQLAYGGGLDDALSAPHLACSP